MPLGPFTVARPPGADDGPWGGDGGGLDDSAALEDAVRQKQGSFGVKALGHWEALDTLKPSQAAAQVRCQQMAPLSNQRNFRIFCKSMFCY